VLLFDAKYLAALKVSRLDKEFVKRVIDAGHEDPEWSRTKAALEKGDSLSNDDYTQRRHGVLSKTHLDS
jgi:hypothetical protein